MVDDGVSGDEQDECGDDANDASQGTGDECFGIEDFGDVVLAGTECSENADFFSSFQNGDVGDNTDHDGGYDQGDGDKGNQDKGYGVDDVGDGFHHGCDKVCVDDDFVILAAVFHLLVVVIQDILDRGLGIKVIGIDINFGWFVEICISQCCKVGLCGCLCCGQHA